MIIDSSTRRNLELVETLREKQKRGSLLWVLDKTKTAMGARLLRSFLEQPLINKREIEYRLDAIEDMLKEQLRLVKFPKSLDGDFESAPKVVKRVRHKGGAK